ncbi:hypothetical protein BT96DRAFT_1003503 [Gymnopus androsaceus JB14]|uniref:Uncharacterized protein n=1 Tax=Gymnopus androsaceus JB14 TaxID=1447944 RepID=A0A6A4GVN1_9AGAR|nr:hypothetical protein BT96DRAFT_1003503 [Gymnopus androsaceus JB14]
MLQRPFFTQHDESNVKLSNDSREARELVARLEHEQVAVAGGEDIGNGDDDDEPVLLRRVSSQRNPSLLDRMSAALKRSQSSSPEASEDESSSLYKKPKMDKSQFDFVQVEKIENYSRDINETVRLIRSQPHLPNLPSSKWKNVLLNSYVEFDTILSEEFNADGEEDIIDGKENIVPCNSSRSKTSRHVIQFDRAARRYIWKQRGVLFDETWKFENFLHPRNSDGKKLAGIGMTNAATMTLAPETTNAQNVVPASTPPPTAPHPIENFLSSDVDGDEEEEETSIVDILELESDHGTPVSTQRSKGHVSGPRRTYWEQRKEVIAAEASSLRLTFRQVVRVHGHVDTQEDEPESLAMLEKYDEMLKQTIAIPIPDSLIFVRDIP